MLKSIKSPVNAVKTLFKWYYNCIYSIYVYIQSFYYVMDNICGIDYLYLIHDIESIYKINSLIVIIDT